LSNKRKTVEGVKVTSRRKRKTANRLLNEVGVQKAAAVRERARSILDAIDIEEDITEAQVSALVRDSNPHKRGITA
jgi:hypothetical protein